MCGKKPLVPCKQMLRSFRLEALWGPHLGPAGRAGSGRAGKGRGQGRAGQGLGRASPGGRAGGTALRKVAAVTLQRPNQGAVEGEGLAGAGGAGRGLPCLAGPGRAPSPGEPYN